VRTRHSTATHSPCRKGFRARLGARAARPRGCPPWRPAAPVGRVGWCGGRGSSGVRRRGHTHEWSPTGPAHFPRHPTHTPPHLNHVVELKLPPRRRKQLERVAAAAFNEAVHLKIKLKIKGGRQRHKLLRTTVEECSTACGAQHGGRWPAAESRETRGSAPHTCQAFQLDTSEVPTLSTSRPPAAHLSARHGDSGGIKAPGGATGAGMGARAVPAMWGYGCVWWGVRV
jgi:hypothetical protein